MMIVPEANFSYPEIQRLYRFNTISESSNGFYIVPATDLQGHEIFLLPRTLPLKDIERRIPYDLLASVPEDITETVIEQLGVCDIFDDTYQITARFVEYLPDPIRIAGTSKPMPVIKPVHPQEATHIQIAGSKDIYFSSSIMCPSSPIEEQLTAIATKSYFTPERVQGYLYVEWLIPCDFRTNKVRQQWAKECPYYK